MRRKDRRRHERLQILRMRRALLQPAPGCCEAGRPQASLCLPGPREDPGREADELGSAVVGDGLYDLTDSGDVALSPALGLEQSAWTQRPRQPRPEAIVIGDPMKRRCRKDRVDSAPRRHVSAVAWSSSEFG